MLVPRNVDCTIFQQGDKKVKLTHLTKFFWPKEKITKADLLNYYAEVSKVLLPHIEQRAMVMKRYPNGVEGEFFFMKRAPSPRPSWIKTCTIEHKNAGPVPYPLINDLPALLWVINLGCIDLNPWYAVCGDFNRPDVLHFDLDPGDGVKFSRVCEVALILRNWMEAMSIPVYAKTTGSKGIHIYTPIRPELLQKEVWNVAKWIAFEIANAIPNTSPLNIGKKNDLLAECLSTTIRMPGDAR